MKTHRALITTGFAASLVLALAGPAASAGPRGLADPIPGALTTAGFTVELHTIASGLVSPTAAVAAPGIANRLYVADQPGVIYSVDTRASGGTGRVFADLRSRSVQLGNVVPGSRYDERGLLGLAFAPDYEQTGLVYTYQTQPYRGAADFSTEPGNAHNCRAFGPPFSPRPCQNVVTQWRVRDPHDPDTTVDPASARELMRIDKPEFNHNAGALAFGPDGYLYISTGDGGFGDDQGPGHVPGGNGQSLAAGNVLGKILRIDPTGHNSANGRYGIPADNPFVGRAGADEIFAYGFRNPYRMAFDPVTGALWTADTGQDAIEEVDVVQAGRNYGWHVKEGTFLFRPGSPDSADDAVVVADSPGRPARLTDPVAEYDHPGPHGTINGEAVVGGLVYRGTAVPGLAGRYIFGDYSRGADQNLPEGRLFLDNGTPGDPEHNTIALPVRGSGDLNHFLLGFGTDSTGEVYVLESTSGVLTGQTGVVKRLTSG